MTRTWHYRSKCNPTVIIRKQQIVRLMDPFAQISRDTFITLFQVLSAVRVEALLYIVFCWQGTRVFLESLVTGIHLEMKSCDLKDSESLPLTQSMLLKDEIVKGTICFAAYLDSGHFVFATDSRATTVLASSDLDATYKISDLFSKTQRVGDCIVLIAGHSLLANMVLNRVRMESINRSNEHIDLHSCIRTIRSAIIYVKNLVGYKNLRKKIRDEWGCTFIVASMVSGANFRFRDRRLGVISSNLEISYSRAAAIGHHQALNVLRDSILNRMIKSDFLASSMDAVKDVVIFSMIRACFACEDFKCGGPIEYFTITQDTMDPDKKIWYLDENRELYLPEVYFATTGYLYQSRGGYLYVSPGIRRWFQISPTLAIRQISEFDYGNEVTTMHNVRHVVDQSGWRRTTRHHGTIIKSFFSEAEIRVV